MSVALLALAALSAAAQPPSPDQTRQALARLGKEADLFDRIAASGTAGVKAVAPTGVESIAVEIPADVDAVSILGEKLATSRLEGDALYTAPGRPVAVISQVVVEYKAAPTPPPPRKPARRGR